MQAAVRTILAGGANYTRFALQRPMVRRRADNVFLASHANGRLFYGPYNVERHSARKSPHSSRSFAIPMSEPASHCEPPAKRAGRVPYLEAAR
jgi:hypothetical protein